MTSEQMELSQSSPAPRVRVRANFSRLVKTGWQFETTVEMTFDAITVDGNSVVAAQLVNETGSVIGTSKWTTEMALLVEEANLLAQDEVDRLNRIDAERGIAA